MKETASLAETGKRSDPPPRQPEAKVSVESKTGKDPSIQGGIQKKREAVGSKTTAGFARQTAPDSFREKRGVSATRKARGDREKATSGEQRGGMSQSPGFTPGPAPPSQESEEVDPNKVIEWLIERRSDKR